MKTFEKKEPYPGFNDAFDQFMAADCPAQLFYCPETDSCFTKIYRDLRNAIGINSEYPGFKPLLFKGLRAS